MARFYTVIEVRTWDEVDYYQHGLFNDANDAFALMRFLRDEVANIPGMSFSVVELNMPDEFEYPTFTQEELFYKTLKNSIVVP